MAEGKSQIQSLTFMVRNRLGNHPLVQQSCFHGIWVRCPKDFPTFYHHTNQENNEHETMNRWEVHSSWIPTVLTCLQRLKDSVCSSQKLHYTLLCILYVYCFLFFIYMQWYKKPPHLFNNDDNKMTALITLINPMTCFYLRTVSTQAPSQMMDSDGS